MSTVAALQGRYITVPTDSLGLPAEAYHDAIMFRDKDDRRYLLATIPSSPHMLMLSSTYRETADLATTTHAASIVNQTRKLIKAVIRPPRQSCSPSSSP